MIDEFGSSDSVKKRVREQGALAGDLHTDMHEVIGHASGKINEGVGPTEEGVATALAETVDPETVLLGP